MNLEPMREWVALLKEKKEYDQKLRTIKTRMNELDAKIVDILAMEEVESMKVDGVMLFPKSKKYARVGNKAAAIKLLQSLPAWHYLVVDGYNTNQLNAAVREYADIHGELPEEFGDIIQLGDDDVLGHRAA